MENAKVDFSADTGKVKPMHAVNNGPVCKFRLPVEYKHHLFSVPSMALNLAVKVRYGGTYQPTISEAQAIRREARSGESV